MIFCRIPAQKHQQQQQQPDLIESAYLAFLAASQGKTQFGINWSLLLIPRLKRFRCDYNDNADDFS